MKRYLFVGLRVIVAFILLQTLFYKFSAHPDSVYIFSTLGMEPFGRVGIGVMELIASILILVPRTVWLGAVLSLGLMSGAIYFHLTTLGVEVNNDNGILFFMAVTVWLMALLLLLDQKNKIPFIGKR